MKKFLAILLILATLLSFTACSGRNASSIDAFDGVPPFVQTSERPEGTAGVNTDSNVGGLDIDEQTTDEAAPSNTEKVKVAIFTDPHSALIDTKVGTRRPSLSPVKIKKMMDRFVKMGVEYVICLGDFIENAYDDEENTEMLEMMMGIIRTYNIPFYTLMGNHDCDAFTKEEFYEIAKIDAVPKSVRIGDALFVYLDANFLKDGTSYKPGNIEWTNTFIPQDQLDYYKKAWQNTDASEVYVFMHQNADTTIPDQRYWMSNAKQVQEALAECPKLKGVYQGHYHKGHEGIINGIPYHTIPAVCEGEEMPYVIIGV